MGVRRPPEGLELRAARRRALPSNDPRDRELTIGCGAAPFNLRVAAAARGYGSQVNVLPGGDPDRLATVAFAPDGDPDEAAFAEAIRVRASTRDAFGRARSPRRSCSASSARR